MDLESTREKNNWALKMNWKITYKKNPKNSGKYISGGVLSWLKRRPKAYNFTGKGHHHGSFTRNFQVFVL